MIRLRYLILSVLVVLIVVSTVPFVSSDVVRGESTVPNWIKNTAGWWASDQIPDSAFLQGIQYLIKEGIIIVEIPTVIDSEDAEEVPGWVKNTAGWWAEDKIHDTTFVSGIKYLIGKGILVVMEPQTEVAKCNFKGKEVVCSLTEKEVVTTNDFYIEVNGGSCAYCLNWAYVGKEYNFQIETFDERNGKYIDGVKISAKIISKDGELRYDIGQITTEDGIYVSSVHIQSMDWYAENILSVTGEYYGVEKTIEKEFEVFVKKRGGNECNSENPFDLSGWETMPTGITLEDKGSKLFIIGSTGDDVNEFSLSIPYCLGNATFTDSFSVSGKETSPQSLAFSTDGTKMFILGLQGKDVTEYTLGTAFDVSTATYVDEKSVDQGTDYDKPRAVDFNSAGTKMRILWSDKDVVGEYVCTTGFDVSTCSYTSSEPTDISSQENEPEGIAFNTDGTKMFIVGHAGDDVNEYACSTGFDVSTCSFTDAGDISGQDTIPRGIAFNADGTKMFILGDAGNDVNEYTLGTGFDISDNLTFVAGPGDISGQETSPLGIAFNTDGTKMFIVGNAGNDVNEYTLDTGFDISDNLTFVDAKDVSDEDETPRGIAFNADGTKMFIVGADDDDVNEYACSTGFDVSACTFTDNFSVSSDENAPSGIAFNTDGTKMFVLGDTGNDINEYACSTGFDVSTCRSVADKDISGQEARSGGMAFSSGGTKMFIAGYAGDDVNEYTLSTAYDVSTATFVDAFSISTHESSTTGLAFDTNGNHMYVIGQGGVEINEYYLTEPWDVSTAYHK